MVLKPRDRTDIPGSLPNQLISDGLEPVLSHTEKLCLADRILSSSQRIKKHLYPRKAVFNTM